MGSMRNLSFVSLKLWQPDDLNNPRRVSVAKRRRTRKTVSRLKLRVRYNNILYFKHVKRNSRQNNVHVLSLAVLAGQ